MNSSLSAELHPAPALVREVKIMVSPNPRLQRFHIIYLVKGQRSTQLVVGLCPVLTMPVRAAPHQTSFQQGPICVQLCACMNTRQGLAESWQDGCWQWLSEGEISQWECVWWTHWSELGHLMLSETIGTELIQCQAASHMKVYGQLVPLKKVISSDTTQHDITAEMNWHVKGGRGLSSSRHTIRILRLKTISLK